MLPLIDFVWKSMETIYLIIYIEAVNKILSLWYKIEILTVSTLIDLIRITNNAQSHHNHFIIRTQISQQSPTSTPSNGMMN